jgi:putative ABC transport system permease protein
LIHLPVLLRIAVRNLREHNAKTRIIGILISLGIAVLVSGNSLIGTAARGIRRTFIENYTGDLVITGRTDKEVSLFGVHGNMMTETVPTLPHYAGILARLRELDPGARSTPQITGYALINHDERDPLFTLLFGIEPDSYRRLFDSIVIQEGAYLQRGEEGILLNRGRVEQIAASHGVRLRVGDPVLLSGFGAQDFASARCPSGASSFSRSALSTSISWRSWTPSPCARCWA